MGLTSRRVVAGLVALAAGPASAHGLDPDMSAAGLFTAGLEIPFGDPRPIVAMLAIGLLLGLTLDRLLRAWAAVVLGASAGMAVAPFAPWQVVAVLMGMAGLAAGLGALWPTAPRSLVVTLATVASAALGAASLQGFGWGEVPPAYRAGLLLGLFLGIAPASALVVTLRSRLRHPAVGIALRIVASWLAAIAVMMAAFELR